MSLQNYAIWPESEPARSAPIAAHTPWSAAVQCAEIDYEFADLVERARDWPRVYVVRCPDGTEKRFQCHPYLVPRMGATELHQIDVGSVARSEQMSRLGITEQDVAEYVDAVTGKAVQP